jgi:hypothetical protein
MRRKHNTIGSVIAILAYAIVLFAHYALAMDTVVLKNGKVIKGAILKMDSVAVIIAPWEDRNVLFPRGDVYTKDEIQAITFDGKMPIFAPPAGEKSLLVHTGIWEMSLAASFRAVNPDQGDNYTQYSIPIRAGYFLARNISAEIELTVSQRENEDTGYLTTASILVHPKLKPLKSHQWLRPFILFGVGFGTGVPQGASVSADADNPLNIVQGGIGLKAGDGRIGLRLEYRGASLFGREDVFQEGYDDEGNYYAYRVEETRTDIFHSVFLGFSVFLGR